MLQVLLFFCKFTEKKPMLILQMLKWLSQMLILGYSRRGNGCICRFKALKKFALKGSESLLGDIAEALENVE